VSRHWASPRESAEFPTSVKDVVAMFAFIAKFPDLEKSVKILLEEGYSPLDVAQRLNMPLILVWAVDSQRVFIGKRKFPNFDKN
jgi:hypothetical protein